MGLPQMFIVTVNILKGSLTDSALNLSHRQVFALVVPFAVAHVAEGLETLEAGYPPVGRPRQSLFIDISYKIRYWLLGHNTILHHFLRDRMFGSEVFIEAGGIFECATTKSTPLQ